MPVYRSWTGCFPASRLFGRLGRSAAWHSQLRGEHRKLVDNPFRRVRLCRGPRRDCPHSLSPIRRRPGSAKAVRRFVRSSGDLEVSLQGQASERPVEPDSVEGVGEGVDAAVQLHEVLVVELPAAVKLVSPRPAFCTQRTESPKSGPILRSSKTQGRQGVRGSPSPMGCRADLRLDITLPTSGERLRAELGELFGVGRSWPRAAS